MKEGIWSVEIAELRVFEFFENEDDALRYATDTIYETIRDTYGTIFTINPLPGASAYAVPQEVNIGKIIGDKTRTLRNKFELLTRHYQQIELENGIFDTELPAKVEFKKVITQYTSQY